MRKRKGLLLLPVSTDIFTPQDNWQKTKQKGKQNKKSSGSL